MSSLTYGIIGLTCTIAGLVVAFIRRRTRATARRKALTYVELGLGRVGVEYAKAEHRAKEAGR